MGSTSAIKMELQDKGKIRAIGYSHALVEGLLN
jgi:hypothetical protein